MSEDLRRLFKAVEAGELEPEEAVARATELRRRSGLVYARPDHGREQRLGFPEVIYAAGKSLDDLDEIATRLIEGGAQRLLMTRVDAASGVQLAGRHGFRHHEEARLVSFGLAPRSEGPRLAVLCAGTTDLPVAEEAAISAELLGLIVERHYDIGVAGLHRLLDRIEELRGVDALIVVAGMEGALPSVVGGLLPQPLIAVPTSVGYGSSQGGMTALHAMLNSCAPGVCVVNIDNGFGAGFAAGRLLSSRPYSPPDSTRDRA